jgi:mRNA-degrading endonuclease RelE of RelBE toxin-antitoxin system
VISRTSSDFRRNLARLPTAVRRQAREAYQLFKKNPRHPSLKFKKLPPHDNLWSIRINIDYRAIGRSGDEVILWFFIGSHAEYDKVIARQ